MNLSQLSQEIQNKKSFLCVGLDVDIEKIPAHLRNLSDPIFEFCKQIVDATHEYAVAYKPNIAFFEVYGADGFKSLEKVAKYIKEKYPSQFLIADAKRGDIGNTSTRYAKTYFETYPFDAITLSPYMGSDSITPYLQFKDKFAILLALTSNDGAKDFQLQKVGEKRDLLYQEVIKTSQQYENADRLMYVVGATKNSHLKEIRKSIPNAFLLVPGIGKQGGDLQQVIENGMTPEGGLLINSSRGIIYKDNSKNFAKVACEESRKLQKEMAKHL